MLPHPSLTRSAGYFIKRARCYARGALERCRATEASGFFVEMNASGYQPNAHIDVLPDHRLISISVPKCASTSVKMILSQLIGGRPASLEDLHRRRVTGLQSPFDIGAARFHRLATDAGTLCFTFVRNPYARLVSAWADKFQGRPLAAGDSFVDQYLAQRNDIDPALPGEDSAELSFPDFVTYATATADRRVNAHWQSQDSIVTIPGLHCDMIGHVETFSRDIQRVLDHVGASAQLREEARMVMRTSLHEAWPQYYSAALAARVYRAYERDFDRFGYARALPADAYRHSLVPA